jgi:integrase
MLDDPNPSLIVRAAISKNRKKSQIPLHPDVIKVLKQLRSESPHEPSDKVFRKLTRMRLFLEDLKRASISYKNGSGFLDFHSFRHTFATNLARSGADEVTRMKLMRHSDSRLTNNTYVDSGKLPTSKAVQSLPSFLEDECPEASKQLVQLLAQKFPKPALERLQGSKLARQGFGVKNPE